MGAPRRQRRSFERNGFQQRVRRRPNRRVRQLRANRLCRFPSWARRDAVFIVIGDVVTEPACASERGPLPTGGRIRYVTL